jgi:beta-glucosidase
MSTYPFLDPDLPLERRVDDLLSRLTLEEKVSQIGIPEYNWWNEGLHGVGRAGVATVFPQAIALAATFDTGLMGRIAAVISDEARAKHHEYCRQGYRRQYHGLTFWSPNVNIFRDPRWGRGQETYGEDPYLTGRMGVSFVKGLQGDDPTYLKLAATPKHFAVHSGPEALRHHFDARVSAKDLRETYLPAFRDCIVEGGAESIMGAYNRTNGEPCCASTTLLEKILRKEWGFKGYVASDCGAIFDIHAHHTITSTPEQSAAMAVKNGCDLECGRVFPVLVEAVKQGLIREEEIDRALGRLFTARFRLGMFDPPEHVPYAGIPYENIDCEDHRKLALEAARS